MGAMPADVLARLRCAECGERLVRGRTAGSLIHKARLVASCDLDSDHAPVARLGGPRHAAVPPLRGAHRRRARRASRTSRRARDEDHPAEPDLA